MLENKSNYSVCKIHSQNTSFNIDHETCMAVFYLVDDFSMFAFTMAIEPLRLANLMLGYEYYTWRIISRTGDSIIASNGICIPAEHSLAEERRLILSEYRPNLVFVISGKHFKNEDKTLSAWLREAYRNSAYVCGLYTGTLILAKTGLLNSKRCAIHWEHISSFRELHPDIDVSSNLYEFDDRIITCGGGNAVMDMMMTYLLKVHGKDLAGRICQLALSSRVRSSEERQRVSTDIKNIKLINIIKLMEDNLCELLSHEEIAKKVNLSRRQIERLFQQYLNNSPASYYLGLRLERARNLLQDTALPVIDIAMACGFVSASHFSKRYRQHFDVTPLQDRAFQIK